MPRVANQANYDKGKQVNEAVKECGTITAAAKQLGISYTSAATCLGIWRSMQNNVTMEDIKGKEDADQLTDYELDDLLDLFRKTQVAMMRVDPVIINTEIDLTKATQPQAFLLAGCMQTGGRWTYHELIRQRLFDALASDNFWIGFFGDDIENFQSGTFAGAFSQYEQAAQAPLQRRAWELFIKKVHSKVKWATWSQHGLIWDEKRGFTYIKQIYLDYGIPFFDGMGYVRIKVGKFDYRVVVSHEFPGSSMYNKTHAQKRALWQRFPNADVIAQADKHQYSVTEEDAYKLEYAAGNRKSPFVHLVQIGTAKGGPDKYTIRGWELGATDWPIMVLWPDRHCVKITRHWDDALGWIGGQNAAS